MRTDILEQARKIRTATQTVLKYIPDAIALEQPRQLYDEWVAGKHYEKDRILTYEDRLFRVVQPVDSLETQTPLDEGMLAVYRPIDDAHTGDMNDPIPFVYGIDAIADKYYDFNGHVYLCKSSMTPCIWEPGTEGVWQWELVK